MARLDRALERRLLRAGRLRDLDPRFLDVDFGWLANPKNVIIPADGTVVLKDTTVSAFCSKKDPTCIYEARWAVHVTLGEAF